MRAIGSAMAGLCVLAALVPFLPAAIAQTGEVVAVALDVGPDDPREGDTLTIWLTIENRGATGRAAGTVHATFSFDGRRIEAYPCGPFGLVSSDTPVPPGSSTRLYCEVPSVTAGIHEISVAIPGWMTNETSLSRRVPVGEAPPVSNLPLSDALAWKPTFLWHRTNDRLATTSWYYGAEHGPGLDDNSFDEGLRRGAEHDEYFNAGSLTSPWIDLRAEPVATLAYRTWWESSGSAPTIEWRSTSSTAWTKLVARASSLGEGAKVLDLAPAVGNVVQLRFTLNASYGANEEGWYVGDIEVLPVSTRPSHCVTTAVTAGYACEIAEGGPLAAPSRTPARPTYDLVVGGEVRVVPLDFAFPFFGAYHSSVLQRDDGRLVFDIPWGAACYGAGVPCQGTPEIVAFGGQTRSQLSGPFGWSSFDASSSIQARPCEERGLRCAQFEWSRVSFAADFAAARSTYAIRIVEDGRITLQYDNTTGDGAVRWAGIRGGEPGEELTFFEGDLDFRNLRVAFTPPATGDPAIASQNATASGTKVALEGYAIDAGHIRLRDDSARGMQEVDARIGPSEIPLVSVQTPYRWTLDLPIGATLPGPAVTAGSVSTDATVAGERRVPAACLVASGPRCAAPSPFDPNESETFLTDIATDPSSLGRDGARDALRVEIAANAGSSGVAVDRATPGIHPGGRLAAFDPDPVVFSVAVPYGGRASAN